MYSLSLGRLAASLVVFVICLDIVLSGEVILLSLRFQTFLITLIKHINQVPAQVDPALLDRHKYVRFAHLRPSSSRNILQVQFKLRENAQMETII